MSKNTINRREKLSDADVISIKRLLYHSKTSQATIALRFKVSQPHICRIANNEVRQDIPWPDGLTHIADTPENVYKAEDIPNVAPDFDAVEAEIYHDENLAAEEMRQNEEIFESIAQAVEDDMNNQLLASILNVESEAKQEQPLPSSAPRTPRIPWSQIKQRQPSHPMVILTSAMSDIDAVKAQRVLEQVFAQLPAHQWYNEDVLKIIRDRWDDLNVTINLIGDEL